jgi:hypothetical protein
MQGLILEVSTVPSGDELASDHAAGVTLLNVTSTEDFDAVNGGYISVNGATYAYTGVDVNNLQLTINPGLAEDALTSDKVLLYPLVVEKWAMVEVQQDEDPVSALVPHALWDRLADGVRDPEQQESARLGVRDGDLVVEDILGSVPVVSGAYIAPETATVSPEVEALLAQLQAQVLDNTTQINNTQTDLQLVSETAYQANDLAATADGRISISDYEPLPADAAGRNEGSIWFTRTRARVNSCVNPSFESNTSALTMTQTSVATEVAPSAIDGTRVLRVTNSGVAGEHIVAHSDISVGESQPWTSSIYAQAVSGVTVGWFVRVTWLDGALAPVGVSNGTAQDLVTDDWVRLTVSATAPAGAVWARPAVVGPSGSEASVWRMDGWLIENSAILGRYFDGSSYDASWSGTAELSSSLLEGGKIIKAFELDDGSWVAKQFMGDTLVDINATEIKYGTLDGTLLADQSVATDKTVGSPCQASEAMTAGMMVNVYNDDGLFKVRKACAADGRECSGFILDSVALDGTVYVYSWGNNPMLSGLLPGPVFLSTLAGAVSNTPPQDSGQIVQEVGSGIGPTVLNFSASKPIYIV